MSNAGKHSRRLLMLLRGRSHGNAARRYFMNAGACGLESLSHPAGRPAAGQ